MPDMVDYFAGMAGLSREDYLKTLEKQQNAEKAANGGKIVQAPQRHYEANLPKTQGPMFSDVAPVDLPGVFRNAFVGEDAAVKELEGKLGQINDPELAAYIGDIVSRVGPSAGTLADQQKAQSKLWENTDVRETAAEKLMREVASRNMENQMKGSREALAQNLKNRGVYGSGAEIAGNLASMQEAASRRSMEEMQANANAQQRALDSLTLFGNNAGKIRDQESNEGQAQDAVSMFNSKLKTQHNEKQAEIDGQNADRQAKRAATTADAKIGHARQGGALGGKLADAAITTVGGAGGNAVASSGLSNVSGSNLAGGLQGGADTLYANLPAEGLGGFVAPKAAQKKVFG